MVLMSFVDGPSAVVVLGGTLLATVLRCGFADCAQSLRSLAVILGPQFDATRLRAQAAVQLQTLQRDGLLRAQPCHFGDAEFDAATDALIRQHSIAALTATHELHQARRLANMAVAVNTLNQAAELAPVFGLAGTLISLGRLQGIGLDRGSYMAAIAMAVHATLYGLIAANLLLAPLAQLVERRVRREESAREAIVDWLAQALVPVVTHAAFDADLPSRPQLRRAL